MKTYPVFSSVARGRLTKSKNPTGFFSSDTRGKFVPNNHLRFFRRTQTFPPKQRAQDSRESLWKFCSKNSTPVFSSHANFSAKIACPRFQGEPVEILFQKLNSGLFVSRKLFRQNKVPKIPWRACGNFVPKHQLRSFRRTQTFQPKQSAQDSTESLLKSKPAIPTTCTFNGADASTFYR